MCLTYLWFNKSYILSCKEENNVISEIIIFLCLKIDDYVMKIFVIVVEGNNIRCENHIFV